MVSLEKLTIGFIGIGIAGSLGAETVKILCENNADYIKKIYVKNRDTKDSIKCVDEFLKNIVNPASCKFDVERSDVKTMVDNCDIIVTGFETSFGAKTGKTITVDNNIRQKLFNGNVNALYDEEKDSKVMQQGLAKALAGYKGLMINATNPPEAMCYWMQKLAGLSEDQIIGFMPDTGRYNTACINAFKRNNPSSYNDINLENKEKLLTKIETDFAKFYYDSIVKEISEKNSGLYTNLRELIIDKTDLDGLAKDIKGKFYKAYERKEEKLKEGINEIADVIAERFNEIYISTHKRQKIGNIKEVFRDQIKKYHESLYDSIKEDALEGIYRGFVLGEHSPNLIGVTSKITWPTNWNASDLKEFNSNIEQTTRDWGPEEVKYYGSTGQECAHHLVKLIKRIYQEQKGTLSEKEYMRYCVQTHYLNLPARIQQKIQAKVNGKVNLESIFTGVPVWFRTAQDKSGRTRIRSFIDPRFDAKYGHIVSDPREIAEKDLEYLNQKHNDFAFKESIQREKLPRGEVISRLLSEEEEKAFMNCIEETVFGYAGKGARLLEINLLNSIHGKPRYLAENEIVAVFANRSSDFLLIESGMCRMIDPSKKANSPWLYKEGIDKKGLKYIVRKSDGKYKAFNITCAAVNDNKLAIITQTENKSSLNLYELPYLSSLDDILKNECEIKERHISLNKKGKIQGLAVSSDSIYLAYSQKIQKQKINWDDTGGLERQLKEKPLEFDRFGPEQKIRTLTEHNGHIFCGLNDGTVKELDSNLQEIYTYDTNAKIGINKVRVVDFNGEQQLFVMGKDGTLHRWIGKKKENPLKYDAPCFDIELKKEFIKSEGTQKAKDALFIYTVGDNKNSILQYINKEDNKLELRSKIPTAARAGLEDIVIAESNTLYLIPESFGVTRICNIHTQPDWPGILDISSLETKDLLGILLAKYRI